MNKYDIVIVGAGISGMSLAHYCAMEGLKTLVIEKNERVGGALHSERFEDIGFWIEMGAHTCYNSYRNLIGIMEQGSFIGKIIPRQKVPFKMLIKDEIKSIPSQLDLLELLLSLPKIFSLKKEGQSVKSYYSKIVGNKNFERVLSPALNAVISQESSNFPADMLFKKRFRRKDIMKKFTLTNGIQTITDCIASRKSIEVITGKEVVSTNIENNLFWVRTKDSEYESESLAIATSASKAAEILKKSFPKVSEMLSEIETNKVESLGVAVKADLLSMPPVAGIIPSSDAFYSVVSRDSVKHPAYRGFTFHFKPNIFNNDAKLKRIAEVLGIKRVHIERIAQKENFVPSLRVGHANLIAKIHELISSSRLLLTGNYFDGMAIEDCVTRSLKEFMRLKDMLGLGI